MDDRISAIDTNIVLYFCEALCGDYDPRLDSTPEAKERLAIFRIFMYTRSIRVPPTAFKEIKDFTQQQSCIVLFQDIPPDDIDMDKAERLTEKFLKIHKNKIKDCRILAEAESSSCNYLLSYDKTLINRLQGETDIEIISPSEFWKRHAPPKESRPILQPTWPNPKITQDWYKW